MVAPLIVTALLPPDIQQHYDELRKQHFPPERNYLAAHLTLFHALPGEKEGEVRESLATAAQQAPLEATISEVRSLGSGVAFRVQSPALLPVRRQIAKQFDEDLTAQDRQKREFHITVQNKVDADTAKQLLEELREDFEPTPTTITGLGLWRYLGGPWEPIAQFPFSDD